MTCEGLAGIELTICQAARAAEGAATAAAKLAEGKSAVENAVSVLNALSGLLMPVAAIWLLWRLWPVLVGIFEKRQFTLKIAGFELSAQEATDQLQKSIEDLQKKISELEAALMPPTKPVATGKAVAAGPPGAKFQAPPSKRRPNRRILWVDDRPAGNAYLIAAFRDDGIQVDLATDSSEALRALDASPDRYDAILSDMKRTEAGVYVSDAGTKIAQSIRARGLTVPIAIFSSARSVSDGMTNMVPGVDLATSSPTEVRAFVLRHAGLMD